MPMIYSPRYFRALYGESWDTVWDAEPTLEGIRLKHSWLLMLELPWRDTGTDSERSVHWQGWVGGWLLVLVGLLLGAVTTTILLQMPELSSMPHHDWLVIGVAVLAGFLIQVASRCWLLVLNANTYLFHRIVYELERKPLPARLAPELRILAGILLGPSLLTLMATMVAPLVGILFAERWFVWYFTTVGPDERTIILSFVGGLFFKTLLVPLIKAFVTGALFKWFMRWLRGGKGTDTKSA